MCVCEDVCVGGGGRGIEGGKRKIHSLISTDGEESRERSRLVLPDVEVIKTKGPFKTSKPPEEVFLLFYLVFTHH